jgi:hypothetical protein
MPRSRSAGTTFTALRAMRSVRRARETIERDRYATATGWPFSLAIRNEPRSGPPSTPSTAGGQALGLERNLELFELRREQGQQGGSIRRSGDLHGGPGHMRLPARHRGFSSSAAYSSR